MIPQEAALRRPKKSTFPSDKCNQDAPLDSQSNEVHTGCSHDHSSERRIFEKSTEDKFKAIRLFRGEGNDHFKSKSYHEALICYKRALLYLDYSIGNNDAEEDAFQTERLKCHLNLAAVYLERKMYDETINQCRLALQIEPSCVKALFRRGVAHLGKDSLQEAQVDLYAALKRGSADGRDTVNAIESAIRDLNVKWREYRRRSRAVAQSVFRS
jgi:tetratricopeptide (TPR) repeat protein